MLSIINQKSCALGYSLTDKSTLKGSCSAGEQMWQTSQRQWVPRRTLLRGGKGCLSQHSLPGMGPGKAKESGGRGISEKSMTQRPCQGLK